MKTKIALVTLVIAVVCAAAYLWRKQPTWQTKELTTIELQQEWFPYAGFSGEIAASKRFSSTNSPLLHVSEGSEQIDPIKLVITGTAHIGVAGADLVAAAAAKGAQLVAIGVINDVSPTVFLSPPAAQIAKPQDFVGKRVGILPGTSTERIYALMMLRQGIDRSGVKESQVPFDLQTYILGEYDVRPAFIYDEPVSLDLKGVSYTILKPSAFRARLMGTVYFTSKELIQTQRPALVSCLASLIKGWRFALANPQEAVSDLVTAYPSLDKAREERALKLGAEYFAGPNQKPLTSSTESWNSLLKGLEELKVFPPGKLNVESIWDPSLLEEAYSQIEKH